MVAPLIPVAAEVVGGLTAGEAAAGAGAATAAGAGSAGGSSLLSTFAQSALRSTASHLLTSGGDQPDDTVDDRPTTVHFD